MQGGVNALKLNENLTKKARIREIHQKGDNKLRLPSLGNRDLIKKTPYIEDYATSGIAKGSMAW